MIDGQQPNLVEIHRFFHRLHEAEAEHAVAGLHAPRSHLQILVRIGNVPFSRRDPVADHARPDHVRDEFVLAAIPGKQNRARATSPVELRDAVHLFRGQVNFILRNTRRPQQTNNFSITLRAQPGKNRRGVLPQIARRPRYFPFLIQRARVELDLRSDSVLVVIQRLQVNAHPVVLVAAFIAQNKGRATELRYRQVCVAISVDIRNRNCARLI